MRDSPGRNLFDWAYPLKHPGYPLLPFVWETRGRYFSMASACPPWLLMRSFSGDGGSAI